MSKNLRDHGLGSSGTPIAVPKWKRADQGGRPVLCPNCKAELCEVEVMMENKLLKGGVGKAHYLGCPACPFASPTMVVSCEKAQSE